MAEKEHIEREATCKDCIHFDLCCCDWATLTNSTADDVKALRANDIPCARFFIPTADVVEVRHGHWQQNPHCKRIYFCSECGRHIEDGSNNPLEFFPYCHCGAKMDGKGGDER